MFFLGGSLDVLSIVKFTGGMLNLSDSRQEIWFLYIR